MLTSGFRFIGQGALLLIFVSSAWAQSAAGQSGVESLRLQLLDVEAKQTELQERARRIDEDLKPENIERSLALTGSTKPEELREQRRRQLESEKEKVRVQLDQLTASRTRLESAIATAEAAVYRQGALVGPTIGAEPQPNADTTTTTAAPTRARPAQQQQPTQRRRSNRARRSTRRRRR